MKKTVLLTSAALVAMTGVATAGTLTTDASTTLKPVVAAKEAVAGGTSNTATKLDVSSAVTGGTFTPGNPGDSTAVPPVAATPPAFSGIVITPAGIPLGTLTDGIMNISSSGKWTVTTGTDTLSICSPSADGTTLEQQLTLKNGTGTSTLIFDKTNGGTGSITNGDKYVLGWGATCAAAPTDGTSKLQLELPAGSTSATLTVTTGLATTQQLFDTAGPATFLTVANQLSAAVTKQVKNQIDFNNNFLTLVDNTQNPPTTNLSSDTIGVSVTAAQSGVPATFGIGDKVITTITVSDPAGLATTGTATGRDVTGIVDPTDPTAVGSGVFGDATCVDIVAATGKIVCTSEATGALVDPTTLPMTGPVVEDFLYTINTDTTTPTAITEKTFSVTTEFDFADGTMQDRTVANGNALLTNAPAGTWTFNGTTIHVPLVKGAGGHNTFIKLQSKVNAAVRGLVLCSDGVSRPVDLGTITAGTPMTITSDTVITALGSTGTVDPNGYAMTLSVTADQSNIFGYANTMDGNGNSRFIPLTAVSGIIQ